MRRPYLPIMASRGCDHHCVWCNKNIHGRAIRPRSVENIVAEVARDVTQFGAREIAVMDDTFNYDIDRAKRICIEIHRRFPDLMINLYHGLRADHIDESLLRVLKACGVHRIVIGVESGNQRVLNKVGKALVLADVTRAIRLIRRAGIVADGYFMLGLPGDTRASMWDTIRFARDSELDHAYFFVTVPFPGTPLWELVQQHGQLLHNYRFGPPNLIVDGQVQYLMDSFTREDVETAFKASYPQFYLRLSKILGLGVLYLRLFVKYRSPAIVKWLFSQMLLFLKRD
jgi:radical SAM superfamily enzyme YgiQ (UPF0313 family)